MAFSEDVTCANVEARCGEVEVPAKVALSFDEGKTVQRLSVGESIVDPDNAWRTVYVIGARTRPAWAPACKTDDGAFIATDISLAIVMNTVPDP